MLDKILLVEDKANKMHGVVKHIPSERFEVFKASSFAEAQDLIAQNLYKYALVDIHLSGNLTQKDGLKLISDLSLKCPGTVIIGMNVNASLQIYLETMKAGAHFLLRKPVTNTDEVTICFKQAEIAFHHHPKYQKNISSLNLAELKYPYKFVFANELKDKINLAAKDISSYVEITGDIGFEKKDVGHLIYSLNCLKNNINIPFSYLDCSLGKEESIEMMLFGYQESEKSKDFMETKIGCIGAANNGILFLDNVECLSLSTQQKFLSVINHKSYTRIGDSRELNSTFQLITGTSKNLHEVVNEGNFLVELKMRMSGIHIHLLPLKERTNELEKIIEYFFLSHGMDLEHNIILEVKEKCKGIAEKVTLNQLLTFLKLIFIQSSDDFSVDLSALSSLKTMVSNHKVKKVKAKKAS